MNSSWIFAIFNLFTIFTLRRHAHVQRRIFSWPRYFSRYSSWISSGVVYSPYWYLQSVMVSIEQWKSAIDCFTSNGIVKCAANMMICEKNCSMCSTNALTLLTLLVYANICLMLLIDVVDC